MNTTHAYTLPTYPTWRLVYQKSAKALCGKTVPPALIRDNTAVDCPGCRAKLQEHLAIIDRAAAAYPRIAESSKANRADYQRLLG